MSRGGGGYFFLSAAGNVPNIKKKSHALSLQYEKQVG